MIFDPWIILDLNSGIPIYVQLVEGIKKLIEMGQLNPGETLPAVRTLALELGIAPATVIRAYGELRHQGLIDGRAGVGTSVTAKGSELQKFGLEARLQDISRALERAKLAGFSRKDLTLQVKQQLTDLYGPTPELELKP